MHFKAKIAGALSKTVPHKTRGSRKLHLADRSRTSSPWLRPAKAPHNLVPTQSTTTETLTIERSRTQTKYEERTWETVLQAYKKTSTVLKTYEKTPRRAQKTEVNLHGMQQIELKDFGKIKRPKPDITDQRKAQIAPQSTDDHEPCW